MYFQEIQMEKQVTLCFICGHQNCEEDSDHAKITSEEFKLLLEEKAGFVSEIGKLKSKLRRAFQKLENHGKINLEQQINRVFMLVDKLHFWYLLNFLPTLKDVQSAIFGFMLTKAQINRLIICLNNENRPQKKFPAFQELFMEVRAFKKQYREIVSFGDYDYIMAKFAEIIEREQIKQRQSKGQLSHPGEPIKKTNEISSPEFTLIYGIPFSTERQSLDLSSLKMNDQTLLELLPSLEKMKNLKEFSLRNNMLTRKGFKILLNILPDLESIDLSNSDSDNFIDQLPTKFPNLKTLYLNDANINSQEKINSLMSNFNRLKVLFLNSNSITEAFLQKLMNKKDGLMYVSVKDNDIKWSMVGQQISNQLIKKGGYFEF